MIVSNRLSPPSSHPSSQSPRRDWQPLSVGGLEGEAILSLRRLQPRLDEFWRQKNAAQDVRDEFETRLEEHWTPLFLLLHQLYSSRYDFFYHLEQILLTAAEAWLERGEDLRALDRRRDNDPQWFTSQQVVGGALYVDLFSGNLRQLRESIGYFKQLGLTYLHLMPLFAVRPGDNDGGYAISDYRSVDPRLGTRDDLRALANDLRAEGISLVLDFVFNHTADDHEWAKRAKSGDIEYQQYFYIFPDRTQPDQYEQNLREIFPTVRRGNFTWDDGMQQWVWTTFNSYQWDLNYGNPAVFRSMAEEMFHIASTGIDVLRLDAVAFIWKRMGTSCENLPQAHTLIQAFNQLVRLGAPGLLFKSEAIVHPDEVVKYISPEECQLSYNPTLMALLWESLATKRTTLLHQSMSHRHLLQEGTAWVNYLRCHDDIGWTFDDGDAASLGINAYDHRQFLNAFYTGQFPGSFARGIPFQEDQATGDMRIAGTLASLAGLERAIELESEHEIDLAARRIALLYSISLSIGGIPLIYLGEEWGMLNDYDFIEDPAKAGDTRWVHRPKMKWEFLEDLDNGAENGQQHVRNRIFRSLQRLIRLRGSISALAGQAMKLFDTRNPHLFGFVRSHAGDRLIVLSNFSDQPQTVDGNLIRGAGMGRFFVDHVTERTISTSSDVILEPYQSMWLKRA